MHGAQMCHLVDVTWVAAVYYPPNEICSDTAKEI
jgi:hypothetical protein